MSTSGSEALSHHLRRLVQRGERAGMTDGQLLGEFVRRRDAAAFEALLRRHGPMVLGVCRRVLGDAHDAEDAFQATFLVLACKAAAVSPREKVGSWLYGVAHTTAVRARSANAKRRARERLGADMPEPEAGHNDLRQTLDEELARLPEKYRTPVVLCDLEGRSRKEVARQLRLPEGTLSSRLTTARRMLATRLARHGLAVSGGVLAAALAPGAASAGVPVALASSTLKAATMVAAGQTATALVSAPVAALTQGVLKTMFLSKLKTIPILLLAAALVGAGSGGLLYRTQAADAPSAPRTEKREAAKEEPVVAPQPKDDRTAIRGVWRVTAMQVGDAERAPWGTMRWVGSRWAIAAGAVDIHIKDGGALGCNYKLDPSRRPKAMDLAVLGHITPAVYALEGDLLQIRLGLRGGTRPRSLGAGEPDDTLFLVLQREPAPKPKAPAEAGEDKPHARKNADRPKTDRQRLQGTWEIISAVNDGEEPGSREGSEWTIRDATVKAVWSATRDTGAAPSYLRFRLDETADPKRIDLVGGKADDLFDPAAFDRRLDRAGERTEGIYSLAGDTLTVCVSRAKGSRPTTFEGRRGSNHVLIVLKRKRPEGERKKTDPGTEKKSEAGSSDKDARVGYVNIRSEPRESRAFFGKILGVLAEHFEQITYANMYDGRTEARTVASLTKRPAVVHEASVTLTVGDEGGYWIAVRVNKVVVVEDAKPRVVGRDEELEREILKRLNAVPERKAKPRPQGPPAMPAPPRQDD